MTQTFLENETVILICMILACLRVYIELTGVDLAQFPLAKRFPEKGQAIHRLGLYLSLGFIVLFAPEVLLG